jgi:PAS domain S-box-containing protein
MTDSAQTDHDAATLGTEPKAAAKSHRQTHAQLRLLKQVMQRCRQAVVFTDANNIIHEVNDAYVAMTGFTREEAIGKTPSIGKSGRHNAAFYRRMWNALQQDNYWEGEVWDRRQNGEAYPKYLTISRILDETGQISDYVAMFEDLTEQKAVESELERRTHYDLLTGLVNKVLFRTLLEHEFHIAERHKRSVGLLLLNLDRFRQVNEDLGYLAGDRLLQMVATRLTDKIRKSDLIARENNIEERSADTISRFGGDEFSFILADLSEPENAAVAARRIASAFEAPFLLDDREIYLSASMGIAVYPQNAATLEDMMHCVEKALDDARQAGGNTFRFFSETMNQTSKPDRSEMRKAIAVTGFALAYQPKIDLASGKLTGSKSGALVPHDGSLMSASPFRWPRNRADPAAANGF